MTDKQSMDEVHRSLYISQSFLPLCMFAFEKANNDQIKLNEYTSLLYNDLGVFTKGVCDGLTKQNWKPVC